MFDLFISFFLLQKTKCNILLQYSSDLVIITINRFILSGNRAEQERSLVCH